MSRHRAMQPLLRVGRRVLLDQTAPTSFLLPKFTQLSRPANRLAMPSLICSSCNFTTKQVRSYSDFPFPPRPPNPNDSKTDNPEKPASPAIDPELSSQQHNTETPPSPTPTPTPSPSPTPAASTAASAHPDLPSHSESRRHPISTRLTTFLDTAQSSLFAASQRLNDLTGYSGIESLKTSISGLENSLHEAQETLHNARANYKSVVASRSATQREVTTLLARQKTWTPADFERFTTLYRDDYDLESRVVEAASELEAAEREAERLGQELNAGILRRYHEEQIWSDKIRRMSTWGTWGLMGVNVLLFFVFQFGAEPWRRRRLVKGFEEKVREAIEEERLKDRLERRSEGEAGTAAIPTGAVTATSDSVSEVLDSGEQSGAMADVLAAIPTVLEEVIAEEKLKVSWKEFLTSPEQWRAGLFDLASERIVALRMRDVSILALEAAATGAAAVVLVFISRA